jgi:hypothetical protein
MTGGFIAGGLGAALAMLAELLVLSAPSRTEAMATGLKYIAAAFIGGEIVLALVIIGLAATIGGTVDPAIGLLTAAMIGVGSFGIALSYRGFAGQSGDVTMRDRAGLILRLAGFQAIGVVGVVITLLILFVSPA